MSAVSYDAADTFLQRISIIHDKCNVKNLSKVTFLTYAVVVYLNSGGIAHLFEFVSGS